MVRLVIKEKKIKSLVLKHQKFENLIQKVCKSKSVDDLVVTNLKKKKLKIRDEILKLTA
tara:strand:+ start:1074 stop:1250 length:177 start_codon:yes stop_codon:yes gene_type:complete